MRRLAAVVAVALLAGCAGPREQIIEDRFDISESWSAPVITEIGDLGGGDVPLSGMIKPEASDGIAVIGETLWIHGRSFGRQPAVTVGGRPAAVLARTRDGGILVRVPPLTPSGTQPVVVSNDVGRGEKPVTVRRYAAVLGGDSGRLAWAEIGAEGPVAASVTPVPRRRLLAFSPDGRAAYVVDAERSNVGVVEIPSNGTPRVVYELDLGKEPVLGLAAAARAWTLAVVRRGDVVLLDVKSPLRPARTEPRALPAEVRDARIISADLSPDGKLLALATEEANRVVLLDLAPRGKAVVVGSLSPLPDVRESVIADIAFSPLGDTLWIATGDTARSRAAGPQPTQVFAARVEGGGESGAPVTVKIARTVTLNDAVSPERLSTGRTIPLASGSAIRLPPERATVFVTGQARPSTEPDDKADKAAQPVQPGAVFRLGAEDTATTMLTDHGHFGQPDLTPDGRWLMIAQVGDDGAVRADGRAGGPRSIPLLGPTPKPDGRGYQLPSVRVQP